jgi:hypothetical protein
MSETRRSVAHETLFLNHTVSRLLSGDRYLSVVRRKLTDKGILRVGQLVQLTKKELLEAAPRTSPGVVDRLIERLANVELTLGMTANGWRSPDLLPRKKKIKRIAHAKRPHTVRRSAPKSTRQP